jgi:hypothetical protein
MDEAELFGERAALVRRLRAYRMEQVELVELIGIIELARATHDPHRETRQRLSLWLLAQVYVKVERGTLAPLRAALLRLGLDDPAPGVGLEVLRAIWPRKVRTHHGYEVWLCDLDWDAASRADACSLVERHVEALGQHAEFLPLAVDMYPSSAAALEALVAAGPPPPTHACGIFMRHMRERAPSVEVLRWAWRGMASEDREQLLTPSPRLKEGVERTGDALLSMLWAESARFQERLLILRLRGDGMRGLWRGLALDALQSPHAMLVSEAVATLEAAGEPDDVPALLAVAAASSGRAAEVQATIREIQRRARAEPLIGALSLGEEASAQGALSLADAARGALSAPGELAPVAASGALAEHRGWLDVGPAPRKVPLSVRLALLSRRTALLSNKSWIFLAIGPLVMIPLVRLPAGSDEPLRSIAGLCLCFYVFGHMSIFPVIAMGRDVAIGWLRDGAIVSGVARAGLLELEGGRSYKLESDASGPITALLHGHLASPLDTFPMVRVTADGALVSTRADAVRGVAFVFAMLHPWVIGFVCFCWLIAVELAR